MFFIKGINQIQCLKYPSLEEEPKMDFEDNVPIHNFEIKNNLMFIISNDFRKGDSNKSIIKVYLLKETSTLICKRSFKNV